MARSKPIVYVVDDSPSVREALRWLIESVRLKVRTFASAHAFLKAIRDDQVGCLVLDVRMPEMSGLELQREMNHRGIRIPVIIVTGHGDVKIAVRAMKAGAFDFLEKPFDEQTLIELIQRAVAHDAKEARKRTCAREMHARLDSLTAREKQILGLVVAGKSSKAIGFALKVSRKTVEFHRANIMHKLQVRSVARLASLVSFFEA